MLWPRGQANVYHEHPRRRGFRVFSFRRLFRLRKRSDVFRFEGQAGPEFRDPALLRRKLNELAPGWADMVDSVIKSGRPLPDPASEELKAGRAAIAESMVAELANVTGQAFGLPALDAKGAGYSEAERLAVLGQYLAYCGQLLEDTRPLAVSPAPTA